ncbi:hypothetical protein NDU88_011501 [Pleurodeles waltl]|uniref:Uncharacterized protein n=1 Tax=Pleurodeles waltl TaxID=8319 RepID=A0AAV7Q1W1_PLEWA|nr:hypothetical protein NDU88_011501 [Pleurodeles waltl]
MRLSLALAVLLVACVSLCWGHRGPQKDEKRLVKKHPSQWRQRRAHTALEDKRPRRMEEPVSSKGVKDCPCHVLKRRGRQRSVTPRGSHQGRRNPGPPWKVACVANAMMTVAPKDSVPR